MSRATVLVLTERDKDWELASEWVERWRDRMALCPEEPGGCLCCLAWWDVDATQEALDELPRAFLAGSEWANGGV
jgi:hypothetical protein